MWNPIETIWEWAFGDDDKKPKPGSVDPLYYQQQMTEQRNKTIRTVMVVIASLTGAALIFQVYKHFTK